MTEKKTEPKNFLVSGSLIGEALAIDAVRKSVRMRLLAANKLPEFSSEKISNSVDAFLREEEQKKKDNLK